MDNLLLEPKSHLSNTGYRIEPAHENICYTFIKFPEGQGRLLCSVAEISSCKFSICLYIFVSVSLFSVLYFSKNAIFFTSIFLVLLFFLNSLLDKYLIWRIVAYSHINSSEMKLYMFGNIFYGIFQFREISMSIITYGREWHKHHSLGTNSPKSLFWFRDYWDSKRQLWS